MERSAELVASRIDEMIQRCRDAGMNVTPQRIAIYRALLQSTEHPTPEMLYGTVSREMPSLSLATIYKSIETLESLGLVREIPVVSESRRYDANIDAHHHLVCNECGKVSDYYNAELSAVLPRRRIKGFKASAVTVNFTGVCADCISKQP